jgi:hypothetical protein
MADSTKLKHDTGGFKVKGESPFTLLHLGTSLLVFTVTFSKLAAVVLCTLLIVVYMSCFVTRHTLLSLQLLVVPLLQYSLGTVLFVPPLPV